MVVSFFSFSLEYSYFYNTSTGPFTSTHGHLSSLVGVELHINTIEITSYNLRFLPPLPDAKLLDPCSSSIFHHESLPGYL